MARFDSKVSKIYEKLTVEQRYEVFEETVFEAALKRLKGKDSTDVEKRIEEIKFSTPSEQINDWNHLHSEKIRSTRERYDKLSSFSMIYYRIQLLNKEREIFWRNLRDIWALDSIANKPSLKELKKTDLLNALGRATLIYKEAMEATQTGDKKFTDEQKQFLSEWFLIEQLKKQKHNSSYK